MSNTNKCHLSPPVCSKTVDHYSSCGKWRNPIESELLVQLWMSVEKLRVTLTSQEEKVKAREIAGGKTGRTETLSLRSGGGWAEIGNVRE